MKIKSLLLLYVVLGWCTLMFSCRKATDYGNAANYLRPSAISVTWRGVEHIYTNSSATGNYLKDMREYNVLCHDTDNNNYVQLLFVDSTASRDTFPLMYPPKQNAVLTMSVNDTMFTTNYTGGAGSFNLTSVDTVNKVFKGSFTGTLVSLSDTTKSLAVSKGSFTVYYP